jgi:glycosyltransferase involved in cell wall biosynthesis
MNEASHDQAIKGAFFSVVLCTFNRARLVRRAIESVLTQSFKDWQLLIIDDGSTDHTQDIVQEYIARDPRIMYSFASNQGPAMARNRGIMFSAGRYITFIDSDDEYLSHHLASRHELLQTRPEIDLLHGGLEIIGDPFVADMHDATKQIHISDCYAGGTFFIKRQLAKSLGGFRDLVYGDDSDFARRAIAQGAIVQKTDLSTYRYYRTEQDSLCNIASQGGEDAILNYRKSLTHQ